MVDAMLNSATMQSFARILVITCILLCLTLNYTFPLHRDSPYISPYYNANRNGYCEHVVKEKRNSIQPLNKKSLYRRSNKIKHASKENFQNVTEAKSEINKNFGNKINNVDLRQYEQLVIMKKYPYLDVKELEMKYHPSYKKVRNSLEFNPELEIEIAKIAEPSVSEQEWLNVEISNRGLSGVALPSAIKQGVTKMNQNSNVEPQPNLHRIKPPDENIFESLKRDILNYLDARRI